MNVSPKLNAVDPILVEVTRSRIEAIGQEAAAAVEQTAISPIITESKDYSITICDAQGGFIAGKSAIELHFAAALNAVKWTAKRYGDTIAEGDIFISNDPHNGGGLHPQDIVLQQPVFVDGKLVAWVALCAHMMDMGGMVPGSSASQATECYQEALRLPPVRLVRAGVEASEIWEIMRNNIRSAQLVEMDMRSLVIGCNVAEAKLRALIQEIGAFMFEGVTQTLVTSTERVLRERVALLEDGRYRTIAWVEYGEKLFRVPCELIVDGDRLIYDLREAPPQAPHYFNSKPYIIQGVTIQRMRALLAMDLPMNQSIFNVVELMTTPGTLVDCVMPAPIAAAHMDAAMVVACAAVQCLQLAIHASPKAWGREFNTAPQLGAYGTGRWSYLDTNGQRQVFTILDGSLGGSPAGWDRDGVDMTASLTPWGVDMEYADIEILEVAYPMLFHERRIRAGSQGYGKFRAGAGCEETFSPHGVDKIVGNMTGTKSWFPAPGSAGGLPGATTAFSVKRADGSVESFSPQATNVTVNAADRFGLVSASGGGYGDPFDRDPALILRDISEQRLNSATAEDVYGVIFAADGSINIPATEERRATLRRARLDHAASPTVAPPRVDALQDVPRAPLYPGVVQCGRYAVAEESGAVLAIAPGNWLDGCPMIETSLINSKDRAVSRAYLDPITGRILHVGVDGRGEKAPIEIMPNRWVSAA